MTDVQARVYVAVLLVSTALAFAVSTGPAAAFNPLKPICSAAGFFSGLAGKACAVVQHSGRLLEASKKLVTGNVTGAAKALVGEGGSKVAGVATTALALGALVAWATGGASFVLHETSTVIGRTTAPQLTTTWFSATYWRVAGIAAVLTLPFLFAAAVQALVQSDITLLIRAALGYLPLAMLAVGIAAPMTMLLLSASDQLAAIVSSAAGNQSAHFLGSESALIGALTHAGGSPFLSFLVGVLTVGAALGLWIELMMRAAAVYVIVLMLPLAFAAFVWPARRVWVSRAIELLLALIVSKFLIIAVLALGGAALSGSAHDHIIGLIAGFVLLLLGAFAPWALLRLLPVTEIASAAAGSIRHDGRAALGGAGRAGAWADEADTWAAKAAQMRREAEAAGTVDAAGDAKDGLRPSGTMAAEEGAGPSPAGASAQATGVAGVADARVSPVAGPPPAATDGTATTAATDGTERDLPGAPAAGSTNRVPELPDLLKAGREFGVVLGPEGCEPVAPELRADPVEDTARQDDLGPMPPPQGPEDGRL